MYSAWRVSWDYDCYIRENEITGSCSFHCSCVGGVRHADPTVKIRKVQLTKHSIESLRGNGDAAVISHFIITPTISGKYRRWARATATFPFIENFRGEQRSQSHNLGWTVRVA